jgi:glycosyltransferase involved in cell wall biosynthesis
MLLFKLRGRKVVLTAHNVNAGRRDGRDTLLNRLTLMMQYRLADHTFVHTEKMKTELREQFGISAGAVTVIPYGMNNAVPNAEHTMAEARRLLELKNDDKVVLFFGAIKPYKGLEYLVAAFQQQAATRDEWRLIIAGERKKGSEEYLERIDQAIDAHPTRNQIIRKIEFIPDDDIEIYCKAADVLVLPYTEIFQSGILFLAYTFGLPVIASDVGSFRKDVVEGKTGFICRPRDSADLADALAKYFDSAIFKELSRHRCEIRDWLGATHSWDSVAKITSNVYSSLIAV